MANFEVFRQVFSSSINLLFLKSDTTYNDIEATKSIFFTKLEAKKEHFAPFTKRVIVTLGFTCLHI